MIFVQNHGVLGGFNINIWIINHYAIHPSEPGGSRHYSLAKELAKKGHRVTVVASNFQHGTGRYNADLGKGKFKEEMIDGIRFVWIAAPGYEGNTVRRFLNMLVFSLRTRFNKLLKDKRNKPDIIIGSSPHPFASLAAERLAAYHRVPFIMEVRDLWPQTLVDLGRISRFHPLIVFLSWLEKYLYRKASKIVVLLPGASEYIKNLGISEEKVIWIPNGIDRDLLPDISSIEQKKKRDLFTVMYAGAHGLANNLDVIINAAKVLQDEGLADKILFRLLGEGPEKKNLIMLAKELGLKNVIFEDPVPKKEVYAKLAEADVFIAVIKKSNLYRWGISLNKLFDYLAMAKPIVFGVRAFNDPVREAGAGISVPPEDPYALAEAVKELFRMDPKEREKMGVNGREYVLKNHDFTVLASRLEKVLFEVAGDNGLR